MSIKESHIFDSISNFYKEEREKSLDFGLDCSEIVEDFIQKFGGSAILILSNEWKSHKAIVFKDSNGNELEFLYHYAWLNPKNYKVYDAMLNYYGFSREDYLSEVISDKDSCLIQEVKSQTLKCYF